MHVCFYVSMNLQVQVCEYKSRKALKLIKPGFRQRNMGDTYGHDAVRPGTASQVK